MKKNIEQSPNKKIDTKELFGITSNFDVFGFEEKNDYVPSSKDYVTSSTKYLHKGNKN